MKRKRGPHKTQWDSSSIRALRGHLGMTQEELAQEMGTRQQTISEWETGLYRPRGASARLLSVVAERAQFPYQANDANSGRLKQPVEQLSLWQNKLSKKRRKRP